VFTQPQHPAAAAVDTPAAGRVAGTLPRQPGHWPGDPDAARDPRAGSRDHRPDRAGVPGGAGPLVTGTPPNRPAELTAAQRAGLVELAANAHRTRDWAGWVDTATAARAVLGVPVSRLLELRALGEGDGVAVMAGWTRLWHEPSLPGWWAAQRVDLRRAPRVRSDARADQVRALVAGGSTVAAAAAEAGVTERTAYRYLAGGRSQD